MEIYLEYLVLDNLVANAFIIDANLRVHKRFKRSNLVIGSAVATLIGVVYPLLKLTEFTDVLFKLLSSVVIVIFSCRDLTLREFFSHFLFFYIFSFIYGGAVLAFSGGKYSSHEGLTAVIGLAGILLLYLKRQITRFFSMRGRLSVSVKICGEELRAIWDTGNNLMTEEGYPVIVLSSDLISKINYMDTGRTFLVRTVSGEYCTKLLRLDNISVSDDALFYAENVYFVFSKDVLGSYKVILNEGIKMDFGGKKYEKLL